MNIPIVITGRNRFSYLLMTLQSVFSSVKNPDIWYFDDASDDEKLLHLLYTDDEFEIIPCLWPKNDFWMRYIGKLPKIEKIKGLKNKIKTIRHEKQIGISANGFSTITYIFNQYPEIEYFFLLQDDILFKKNWQQNMFKYISRCDLVSGCVVQKYPTAQCYLLNRKFINIPYKEFIKDKRAGFDGKINEFVKNKSLETFTIHICQHIGVNSLTHPEFDFYKDYRIDTNVFPPYCI